MIFDTLSRVEARIRQIQTLLGETGTTKEGFGSELEALRRNGDPPGNGAPDPGNGRPSPAPPLAPESVRRLVDEAAARTGLSEELLTAVIAAESGFRPDAVSPAGALGLMQLMPATARSLGVSDPFDPSQNVMAGAEYLRRQLLRFGTVEKALAAYNAGPGAVERYGGVPPYAETRSYIRRVIETMRRWMNRSHE